MNVDFVTAIKIYFANYFNFKGRSTRAEYWWAMLFVFIIGCVANFFGPIVSAIVALLLIIPNLAVLTRRFHDGGHSGWWVLGMYAVTYSLCGYGFGPVISAALDNNLDLVHEIAMRDAGKIGIASLVSLVIGIWQIIWCCQRSAPDNQYGPNPWNE